ncbi:ABC-F family ATP-binding cassette domain-containing protein [Mesorhizobium sp. M4B.F.Ca.ET.215.01.1.1]|uniref:ABC-F family ATP-binding cassette domain-containing protein n=4 Tax=Mesorhizobium TaxID=68287 RepID=UPI000FCACEF8|nr:MULTISPECIES: ABC-F family ATP-binding cassette domain-containing protein [unclassified Mesorhizobium]RVD35860.1 ABC-F family ATP-binding cassette domain-containing protein [Mesorhizobium sp. M4B.F.Ca.ET.019.03.1.1]TGQ14381.1 ABC-F family ATP-binding cassette domain-containing protein [Mesorhizobium sp. M4B.F.Ca.ET.215.01.1.1]TGQ47578.1 ABC-F family ATP-binding cassette domain-containing protein [Mesorhizobium sp. M00.F.Ca.ET.220.01.1.1]TGR07948.1 ABC-F family ATP-binding cassette domain-con
MALISLKSLGVTMSAPLFSNLDLTIAAGDRLGIVAANGRGKSTLLKCLTGELEATSGDITRSRGLRVGHVEQSVPDALLDRTFHQVVADALPPDQADSELWRVDVVLDSLDVPEPMRERAMRALSGGWQRLALIARAWVAEPDVLLLDEPTNHLDLAKIGQLENWLNALPREVPVIIASHDRAFLDATTNRTLFLRPEQSPVFSLPYSRAREALDDVDASTARKFERDMKVAQQLRRQAAKLNNIGINSGSDLLTVKTKQLNQRAEKLEDAAMPAHRERSAGAIRLANSGTHAKVMITLDDAAVETPDGTLLFRTGKRHICQGDRIVLLGRNGVGKSRFVTLLRNAVAEPESVRNVKVTPSTMLGYSDQALSGMSGGDTPLAMVTRRFDIGEQRARSLLAGAGVAIDMQARRIGLLSGGQKARLVMLALRLANPNFYLLDEPTNHLDIDGQEALEAELLAQQASCVLASHDRAFIRAVGNRFWLIEKRRLTEVDDPEDFFRAVAEWGN